MQYFECPLGEKKILLHYSVQQPKLAEFLLLALTGKTFISAKMWKFLMRAHKLIY